MRVSPIHILGLALAIAVEGASAGGLRGQEPVQQIVDFRDGTVLKVTLPDLELPWRRISEAGVITENPVKLSQIDQLRFVLTPATEQVAEVRRMVIQLGDEDYHVRERAQSNLLSRGAKFRSILEQTLPQMKEKDPEVAWRLREILNELAEGESLVGNDYDQLQMAGAEDEIHGDVGHWSVRAQYRGQEVLIDRASVLAIRNAPLGVDLSAEPTVVHLDRIVRDDDEHFPKDVTRIDFDKGPRGEALAPGLDIAEVYVPLGCTFATSYEDSYVSIQPYNVGGRSGGRCAATHKPLYQGTITIRFCKPGNPRLPAGVRYVGFWTSHIAPEGTALQAYDARDRMIAEIKTQKSQREFLALTTNVPIAYIKIVPDEEIDPDYAIDDLVFDAPKPLSEAGDPDRYSVVLKSGERLYSAGLERAEGKVTLSKLTVGVDEIQVDVNEIGVLVPPRVPVPEVTEDRRCFVRLADGSVLRANGDNGLKFARFVELPLKPERLVALWGAQTALEEPAEDAWPDNGAVLMRGEEQEPAVFRDWKLAASWIESTDLEVPADDVTYASSPAIWFQKPGKRPENSGLLRTSSGEEIVLGTDDGFVLKDWSSRGVTIAHGEHQWTLALNDVSSLLLPR